MPVSFSFFILLAQLLFQQKKRPVAKYYIPYNAIAHACIQTQGIRILLKRIQSQRFYAQRSGARLCRLNGQLAQTAILHPWAYACLLYTSRCV